MTATGKGENGPYEDFPLAECIRAANERGKDGFIAFQKFTCEQCGQRLMIDAPGAFYTTGECDQCGYVTDIEKRGCNYLLVKFPL